LCSPSSQQLQDAYANNLHPKQPVTAFPPLRDAYFKKGLEEQIFNLLNDLSENNPFCDVVFTGHSFGAALATIGSLRYVIDHPMNIVLCHAFGSPKVGAQNFREHNKLPCRCRFHRDCQG
jgi:predicted lipase